MNENQATPLNAVGKPAGSVRAAPYKHIILGHGKYSVAQSSKTDGTPCLTIRKLPSPEEPGTLLEPNESGAIVDYEVVVDVLTPSAASVLLIVAQHIAFAHGIAEPESTRLPALVAAVDKALVAWYGDRAPGEDPIYRQADVMRELRALHQQMK